MKKNQIADGEGSRKPWKMLPRGSNQGEFQIVDADGFFVALVHKQTCGKTDAEINAANAALIVSAVNSNAIMVCAIPNAARIACELFQAVTPAVIDSVQAAALALAEIECGAGFSWEKQPADWESVCAKIARVIDRHVDGSGKINWSEHLRLL